MDSKSRIGVLDGFRGIAAMCVVYHHYTDRFRTLYGHSFSKALDFHLGAYSVWFFFVISGFAIFLTVEKCKSVGEFVYRRITRLYPTFWICIIFTVLMAKLLDQNYHPAVFQIAANFTMIPRYLHVDPVDIAYWTLVPELIFYIIVSIAFTFGVIKKIFLWGSIWLAISLINGIFQLQMSDILFRYTGFFFSGVLFYLLFKGERKWLYHIFILICYVDELLVMQREPGNLTHVYLTITVIYLVFYLFVFNRLNFLNIKILRFLGYISYPLYLIHTIVGTDIILDLNARGYKGYWVIFIPIAFSILVAFLITKYLEAPLQKYARDKMPFILSKLNKIKPV